MRSISIGLLQPVLIIFFAKTKVDTRLSDLLAESAVDGMFLAMGHEEQEIRKDPSSLGKAVVTKVFDYYMKNR